MRSVLAGLGLLVVVAAYMWPGNATRFPPGVRAPYEPSQSLIGNGTPWETKGYRVTPLADFRVQARVIMTDRYWFGRESDLSPVDLTLGWGALSDQRIIDQIVFVRERRAYNFRPKAGTWPIPVDEIVSHSANMHMIPANSEIDRVLKSVAEGNNVDASGYLVEVKAPDGWCWRSSLSRTDTGPGACEVMWVNRLTVR